MEQMTAHSLLLLNEGDAYFTKENAETRSSAVPQEAVGLRQNGQTA